MRTKHLLALLATLAGAEPAGAQQYGQWWWEGEIRWGQRFDQGTLGGLETRQFEQRASGVRLDLNGFLGHPAIGDFKLGFDFGRSDYVGALAKSSDALGYHLNLRLIPSGDFPITLAASRSTASFPSTTDSETSSLGGAVEESTHLRAKFFLGRGPFSGMHLEMQSSRFDFVDPGRPPDERDERTLAWSRKIGRFAHNLKVRNETSLSGGQDLGTEYWLASMDQTGELGPWRSFVVLRGARIEIDYRDSSLLSESLAASSSLSRAVRQHDAVTLSASFNRSGDPLGARANELGLGLNYQWRPKPGWTLSPFGHYRTIDGDGRSEEAIQTGFSLSRTMEYRRLSAQISAGASLTESTARGTDPSVGSSTVGARAAISISHSTTAGSQRQFELEYSQDEFSSATRGDSDFAEDDLLTPIGRQDRIRSRVRVDRRFGALTLGGQFEWSRAEETGSAIRPKSAFEGQQSSMQVGWGRVQLIASLTESRTRQLDELVAQSEIGRASVTVPITRSSRFSVLYRADRRRRFSLPTAELESLDGFFTFSLGRLTLDAGAFERRESLMGLPQRIDRGFRWSVSRRLAGWLPIVTGAQRRGVIR